MWIQRLLKSRTLASGRRPRRRRSRLTVRGLEDRVTPATFTVDNALDDGSVGSLRAAIALANASPDDDIVDFDPAFFNTHRDIVLATPLPAIPASGGGLTIEGPGAALLTVDAGNAFRVLDSTAPVLNLSGFTITGGLASNSDGGGIRASGILTLDDMVVTGNAATGAFSGVSTGTGGGIGMNAGGFLMVRNSTISGNTAGTNGGGIGFYSGGSLVVENSTISGNSAIFPGNPYGYYSNYIGNYGGGGILLNGAVSTTPPAGFTPGVLVIRNSTIANNSTTGSGGGVFMRTSSGTLLLQNSTVSGNSADASGYSPFGSYPYGGGGIKRFSYAGDISIVNSVVAGNTNASIPDVGSGGPVEVDYSAIGNTTGFTLTGANNVLNTDPVLGPLVDNGGPTLTMAPLPGSPLIDAGADALAPTGITDQRGFGYYRSYNGRVDIGAVEVQPPGLPFLMAQLPGIVPGATTYQFTVTYADPTGTNNGIDVSTLINNNSAVRVTGPFGFDVRASYVSIDDPTDGTPRTVTYSLTPPGGSWDNRDDGEYSFRLLPGQVADVDGNLIPDFPLGTIAIRIQPFLVTNANDAGDGSLRAAINLANLNPGDDVIEFDPGFFSAPRTIDLQSELPTFSATGGGLTITGPGVNNVTVDGGGSYRVFNSLAPTLNLSGMTVTGGFVSSGYGAGLRAGGIVTVDHMVFTANRAEGSVFLTSGGAIGMGPHSSLTVRDTTIADNSAVLAGGGIYFRDSGSFVLENSTVSGNSTSYTGDYYGIYGGGGVFFAWVAADGTDPDGTILGTLVVRNSTIANNTTTGSGGGILAQNFFGDVLVQDSTISGNTAAAATTGYYGPYFGGGGIAVQLNRSADTLVLKNSIVSGNNNGNGPDIFWNDRVDAHSSAIGSTAGFFLSPTSGNNLIGQDLHLGPLQDNGGPTQTMALGAGSAAIDAGSEGLVPIGTTSDQRGFGYYRLVGSAIDIGAFEAQPVGGPFAVASTPAIVPDATTYQFTVTYADPVGGNNGIDVSTVIGNNDAVHVVGPGGIDLPATYVGIDDATDGTPRAVTYAITPPGGSWNNYDTGLYSVRLQPDQVADVDGNVAPATSVGRFQVVIAPFVVLNANDSGDGSLRAALELANARPEDDTIVFDPAYFATPRTIALATPLPTVFADGGGLTVAGPGAAYATVDAGGNFRVLDSEAPTLTLSGLTITGGRVNNDNGGGIRAGGIVTLDGMAVTNNEATGLVDSFNGIGGGIEITDFGFLTVRNSTISGNIAGVLGGGIGFYSRGSLVVENSTISGNQATPGGNFAGYYGGGGIAFYDSVSDSPPPGFTPAVLVIRNSTLVNNSTTGSGGAFLGVDIAGTLLIQDSTVTGNSSSARGTNYYDYPFGGGGLAIVYGGDFVIQNCVISGNTNANAPDILCQYDFVDSSYSLIGSTKGFSESNGAGNLPPGTDPMLGPLQDNGGLTRTSAPLPGSPLVDRGSSGLVPAGVSTDQRGAGFDRIVGSAVDLGAVEIQPVKEPGTLAFSAATYETNEQAATVRVTVSRTGGSDGAVSIDYGTVDDTAHAGTDYTATSGTLSWAAGETGDKTFDIPILDDALNEGQETLRLTLTNPFGDPGLGLTTATVAVAPSDPQGPGVYRDQDGDKYTIKLAGKVGSLAYYRSDPDGDGNGPIELIELSDTLPDPLRPKASLVIAVAKARMSTDGGTVGLGAVTGSGLASIVAPRANLDMEGIDLAGYLRTLRIGNIENGADVRTLAAPNPGQKTSISARAIGDGTELDIGAGIGTLVAASFGAGSVEAPSIGTMVIQGDMAADVSVSGAGVDPGKKALAALRVGGVVSGSDISVAGNVGSVVVGAFRDSRLFVGYAEADDGSGTFVLPATLTTFRATGPFDGFQDSRVIATSFKTVVIRNVDATNDGEKFGFYADDSLGSISVIGPTKFRYDPGLPTPQGIGNFEVKIV